MSEAPKIEEAGPLSHSSAKTLLSCEQKYTYYKVLKTPYDADYQKSDALAVGSAFHYIQEEGWHKKVDKISDYLDHCEKDPDIGLNPSFRSLVHGMCVKYWRLHEKSGLKVLAIEFEIGKDFGVPEVSGRVDALMEDAQGKWWIVDLKTAKTLYIANLPLLPQDPQLNLYAYFASGIAEKYGLKMENFGGCRWETVTKPSLKKKDSESFLEYTKRIVKSCKAYDIEVPIELMHPEDTFKRHIAAYDRSKRLRNPKAKVKRNYGNCMSYFRPCEYWSKCHNNKMYSETEVKVREESEIS